MLHVYCHTLGDTDIDNNDNESFDSFLANAGLILWVKFWEWWCTPETPECHLAIVSESRDAIPSTSGVSRDAIPSTSAVNTDFCTTTSTIDEQEFGTQNTD